MRGLGAAMQATRLPFGVVTCPSGWRYHPAVVAQAIATLGKMFPGRFWAALGSGEFLNEHVTGERWPEKAERNARLHAAADIIRALLRGEEVSRDGPIRVRKARVFPRPREPPPLIGAALSEATAREVAAWADGLVTINLPDGAHEDVAQAYRDAGGKGPLRIQVHLAWAPTEEQALRNAHRAWRANVFPSPILADLETPEQFDALAAFVRPDDLRGHVEVSADLGWHAERIRGLVEAGFDEVLLHEVGPDQEGFLEAFGREVLPDLQHASASPARR